MQKHLTLRLLKAASVSIVMGAFNAGVFYILVGVAGMNPFLTNLLRAGTTMQVRFVIARHYTWRDRRDESVWVQWRRHVRQKIVSLIAKQLLFALLIFISLHYLLAYFICATLGAVANHMFADKYVFRLKAAT